MFDRDHWLSWYWLDSTFPWHRIARRDHRTWDILREHWRIFCSWIYPVHKRTHRIKKDNRDAHSLFLKHRRDSGIGSFSDRWFHHRDRLDLHSLESARKYHWLNFSLLEADPLLVRERASMSRQERMVYYHLAVCKSGQGVGSSRTNRPATYPVT